MSEERLVKYLIFGVSEDNWERFYEMMDDSDTNYKTWKEWKKGTKGLIKELKKQKKEYEFVYPDLDEFEIWCKQFSKPKNGASRAEYTHTFFEK